MYVKGVIYLGQGIFYRDLVNKSEVNMTKDKVNSKYLTITKKVKISEVNHIILISTL